ncbi:MAG: F0F1 ATP synthase subunit epsilon [Alphaproteobacteria bacterium]|nr:MAG: F0F1 ATP synthase subunit epsilon [Alphaproteobacteria bacterium]
MADVMKFDLVSPERRLASIEATAVRLPGSEGEMTVMAAHQPTVTTLRPGIVRAEGPEGVAEFVVISGFAEIAPDSVSVLAERAYPRAELGREELQKILREAEEKQAVAETEERDLADRMVADIAHLLEMME